MGTSRSISDFSSYCYYLNLFAFIVSLKPDIRFISITDKLSAKMSGLSGPNVEEENMWAVTLSGTKREYEWAPEDPSDSVNADDSVDEESDPSFKPYSFIEILDDFSPFLLSLGWQFVKS